MLALSKDPAVPCSQETKWIWVNISKKSKWNLMWLQKCFDPILRALSSEFRREKRTFEEKRSVWTPMGNKCLQKNKGLGDIHKLPWCDVRISAGVDQISKSRFWTRKINTPLIKHIIQLVGNLLQTVECHHAIFPSVHTSPEFYQ